MSTIVTRAGKGSPLTHNEVDANFNNLNNDKYQSGDSPSFAGTTLSSGNLTFSSTGQRITGNFGSGTIDTRIMFQSSTTNTQTNIAAVENGTTSTGTGAAQLIVADSNYTTAANFAAGGIGLIKNTDLRIFSSANGTGTYLPLTFYTGGSERMRLDTSGNLGIGTASFSQKLAINSANTSTNSLVEYKQGDVTQAYVGMGSDNILRIESLARPTGVVAGGANYVFINTNGSERMRITSGGDVAIGTTAALTGAKFSVDSGSANATTYTTYSARGGSTMAQQQQSTTSVSTSLVTILTPGTGPYTSLCLVFGISGADRFVDLILFSVGTGTVNVINSLSASGTPAARTYAQNSSTLQVSVASGTYTVSVTTIGMGA